MQASWHWYRYEYAVQRGSIHCHGVAKLKNDPGLCSITEKALKGYLASKYRYENKKLFNILPKKQILNTQQPTGTPLTIHKLLKTSRPGKHVIDLTFTAYLPDNRLCPIVCLSENVKRTSKRRTGSEQLFVSIQKPYKPVFNSHNFAMVKDSS